MSCGVGNLFWGMQFALFLYKTALNRLQVLFRLFRIKTAQSHTAITSIVFHAIWRFSANLNFKHKRGSSFRQVRGLRSHEQGNKTWSLWLLHCVRKSYGLTKRVARLPRNCQRHNAIRLSLAF